MKKIYLFLILFISATLFADNQTFTHTGSTQTLTVPSGVTEMTFKIWGAGGAGGSYGSDGGGSGGYAEGTFTVTPGDNLIIAVGGGGEHGIGSGSGGNGGWPGGGGSGYINSTYVVGSGTLTTGNDARTQAEIKANIYTEMSERAIVSQRYRIRQKMGLGENQNLDTFLMGIY